MRHPLLETDWRASAPRAILILTGGACSLVGATVLAGWIFQIPSLTHVQPSFNPMVVNTAIGFILDGLALLFIAAGWPMGALPGAVWSLIVGVLTLAEFGFSVNLRIDELFVRDYLGAASNPGRAAPNSACCLVLCGVALLWASTSRRRRKDSTIIGMLGAMVTAVGAAALFGVLSGVPMYVWGNWKPMVASTGVSFAAMGLGIMALAWQHGQGTGPGALIGGRRAAGVPAPWLALIAGCAAMTIALCLESAVATELWSHTERAVQAGARLRGDTAEAEAQRQVEARREANESNLPEIMLSVGVLTSVLLYLVINLAVANRRRAVAAELATLIVEREMAGRERAETGLRHLASIVHFSDDAIIGKDIHGTVLSWNPAAEHIFGYTAAEMIGQPIALLVPPDSEDEMPAVLARLLRGERVVHYETVRQRKDGQRIDASLTISPILDAGGKVVGASKIARDITDRKLSQQKLTEAYRRTASILDSISDGFNAFDREWRYTDVNAAAAKMLGKSPGELLGKSVWELWPQAVDSAFGVAYRRAVAENVPVQVEEYYPEPLNTWFEARAYPSPDGLALFFTDITERKRAAKAVQESQAQLVQLLQLSLSVIGETNMESLLQKVAEAARHLTDGQAAVAGHQYIDGMFSIGGAAPAPGAYPPVEAGRTVLGGVYRSLFEGSDLSFRFTDEQLRTHPSWWGLPPGHPPLRGLLGTRFIDRHGQPKGLILVTDKQQGDFTDGDDVALKQLGAITSLALQRIEASTEAGEKAASLGESEERLRQLNATLELRIEERTARLGDANRELEAFSYSVSHDLRAPLRAVEGFSKILLRDYLGKTLDERAADYMHRMSAASQRMGQLIADMLMLSRVTRQELTRQRVDLSAMVAEILAELAGRDPQRSVSVEVQPGLVADGDPRLLRVALDNLFGNAWKFTGKTASARIGFGVTRERDNAVYFVRDNGAGFDMAYSQQLFEPFQRLHRTEEFEGTGIGLATVQRIVRRHGGRVWAEAAPGEGATFHFTLGAAA